ncbi:hypothetical protein B0J11DRAFT_497673 [Dendryphion nanum]|uniref:Zn(2)-C6 fungal-type domain-containing protein n=1 Tax=Dendryphion nanum TaxID=256645 RepID=A0A9P9D6I1_9PLEO|nr:hypothetical protein B0J11DRAFT_497673 [Dendryphion nanum]
MHPKVATTSRPTPLACLQCRETHLKCAGDFPSCARCVSRGLPCTYTTSNRGRRRAKRRSHEAENRDAQTPQSCPSEVDAWIPTVIPELNGFLEDRSLAGNNMTLEVPEGLPILNKDLSSQPDELARSWSDDEHLVDLYYLNFHGSHPILLPRSLYSMREYSRPLKSVVELIGNNFSPGVNSDILKQTTEVELENGDQNSPEMVQACILYAIMLVGMNELSRGQDFLAQAIDIALKLGMNREGFASSSPTNHPFEVESMRRTWWELCVTDGYISAFLRRSSSKTSSVSCDVMFPSDDYTPDKVPACQRLSSRSDYERSFFAEEEMIFPSFCYRIEAVRLLGRVLTITGAHGVHRDQVQAVDNALAAFIHHLPTCKSEPEIADTHGGVDHLMFQAHTVIQYATILLHFPRSDLSSPVPSTNTLPGSNNVKFVCPCTRQKVHSIKAIDSSKDISMLAAFRMPTQCHSPFFVYPLALAAVVQLSISTTHSRSSANCLLQHYERVKLILGVLKSLSRYWPIAGVMVRALNKISMAVFQPSHGEPLDYTQQNGLIDNAIELCSYNAPYTDNQWLEAVNLSDIHELIGLGVDTFCT